MIPAQIQQRLERQQKIDELQSKFNGASWAYFAALKKGSSRIKQIEEAMHRIGAELREAQA